MLRVKRPVLFPRDRRRRTPTTSRAAPPGTTPAPVAATRTRTARATGSAATATSTTGVQVPGRILRVRRLLRPRRGLRLRRRVRPAFARRARTASARVPLRTCPSRPAGVRSATTTATTTTAATSTRDCECDGACATGAATSTAPSGRRARRRARDFECPCASGGPSGERGRAGGPLGHPMTPAAAARGRTRPPRARTGTRSWRATRRASSVLRGRRRQPDDGRGRGREGAVCWEARRTRGGARSRRVGDAECGETRRRWRRQAFSTADESFQKGGAAYELTSPRSPPRAGGGLHMSEGSDAARGVVPRDDLPAESGRAGGVDRAGDGRADSSTSAPRPQARGPALDNSPRSLG